MSMFRTTLRWNCSHDIDELCRICWIVGFTFEYNRLIVRFAWVLNSITSLVVLCLMRECSLLTFRVHFIWWSINAVEQRENKIGIVYSFPFSVLVQMNVSSVFFFQPLDKHGFDDYLCTSSRFQFHINYKDLFVLFHCTCSMKTDSNNQNRIDDFNPNVDTNNTLCV